MIFTITHFDCCTGEDYDQDYRWSFTAAGLIELEADSSTTDDPDWIFEAELADERELDRWIAEQATDAAAEREIWESDD